jgi:Protein kinase domain
LSEAAPRTIGRYQVLEEIGRGTMGLVYRALDPDLERTVALKTVRLAFAISSDQHEQFEKRFLAEARAAASLSHPGIVTVHDVGRDPATGTLYIALEHLPGCNLDDLTGVDRKWPWREAARLVSRVAAALHHAHERGIVHRDVKPANIRVLPSGEPKVMDFGIAKLATTQLTAAGEFFGTPLYMSPEQSAGLPVDGRSDLFSLGVILYLLLTGRQPFEAPSVAAILSRVAHHDPPAASDVAPGTPVDLDTVVRTALAKDPRNRYPSARALAEDLEDVLAGRPPRHCRRAVVSALPGWTGGRMVGARAKWSAGIVSVLVAATLLVLLAVPGGSGRAPGSRGPVVRAVVQPARLEVQLEHSLRSGMLKVWIDESLVLEEPIESHVTRKVLFVKTRRGREEKTLEVSPGEHDVRVLVEGDGFHESRRIRGEFQGGRTRRLLARVEGLLAKDLSVAWE